MSKYQRNPKLNVGDMIIYHSRILDKPVVGHVITVHDHMSILMPGEMIIFDKLPFNILNVLDYDSTRYYLVEKAI